MSQSNPTSQTDFSQSAQFIQDVRERIATVPFVSHRLLEQRLAPRPLLCKDLLRTVQLRFIFTLRFLVGDDAFQADVNGLYRPTARTNHFELR